MIAFVSFIFLSLLAMPGYACEGQCIVQITHAFIGNYSAPVQHAFADAAALIARTLLPSHDATTALNLVEPLLDAYEQDAYDVMEKAIFPSHFHGKCQVNGVDPKGCPNPDCPVVCGTPGSMVHFYAVLKQIAFNATASNIVRVCSPSSTAYVKFEAAVLHTAHGRATDRRTAAVRASAHVNHHGRAQKRSDMSDQQIKANLRSICGGRVKDLERECGGRSSLPNCSWEDAMKEFILSFP